MYFWHIFWCASISWNHVGQLVVSHSLCNVFKILSKSILKTNFLKKKKMSKMAKFGVRGQRADFVVKSAQYVEKRAGQVGRVKSAPNAWIRAYFSYSARRTEARFYHNPVCIHPVYECKLCNISVEVNNLSSFSQIRKKTCIEIPIWNARQKNGKSLSKIWILRMA